MLVLATGAASAAGSGGPPQVSCRSCVVVDESGRVLWARAPDEPVAIASATKMVTALVVRDRAALSDEVVVSDAAASTPGGKLSLLPGQSATVGDLLWALLLNSSNDAAVALAEHVAGSEAAFVRMMEEQADRLGARSSDFETSHGLDSVGHRSTALDLTKIAASLLEDPFLAEVVASPTATITISGRSVALENTNTLLETYRGAIGIKTGFTADAGNVLVAAAERDGRRLISVALGSSDHFADSASLLDIGFRLIAREVLLRRGTPVAVLFTDGAGAVPVIAARPLRGLRPPGATTHSFAPLSIEGPVERGQVVGTIRVSSGEGVIGSVPAVAAGALAPAGDGEGWMADVLAGILRTTASIMPGNDL